LALTDKPTPTSAKISNKFTLDNNELQRVVDTCCLGCVFSAGESTETEEEGKVRFSQWYLGCRMGALLRYQNQGEDIEICTDNGGNEFYVVSGRVCPFFRPSSWHVWAKDQDISAAQRDVRKEAKFKPDVVIYYDGTQPPEAIMETLDALKEGGMPPTRIYVANNSDLRPSQIMKVMESCPFPWRIETMIENKCSVERSLDVITKKCDSIFVTYFSAGYKPSKNFFKCIDIALYDELDKFICLEPSLGTINGLTVVRLFYKQADGNARSPIWEKAKKISEDQKCQYLVRPVTEIVNR
jgi:hypothetical protein